MTEVRNKKSIIGGNIMKKMIIVTMMATLMLTGCGKEVNETLNTETTVVETVQTEAKETEKKVSDEYLAEMEYNSQTNGF